jgi:hypothetical protein
MNGRRYLGAFCALTVVWALLLLVGPRHPDPIFRPMSYRNVDLPGPFGLSLSVDSPLFIRLALEPSELFKPRQLRQSRPGMVLAAAPLALVLARVVQPPEVASFLAYVVLHIATLVACFALYLAIVRAPGGRASLPVFLVGLLLLFNDVVTYFMLSPHTALCNILAPLLCLWVADRAWRDDLFHDRRVFLVALLSGVGFASYGSFVLAIPALLLPAAVREWSAGRAFGLAFLGRAAAISAVVLAPVAAWTALVVAISGAFYSAEVDVFRMFVWMIDGLRAGGWEAVAAKLGALTRIGARSGLWMALPALLIVAMTFVVHPPPRRALWLQIRGDAALAVFICLLFGVFFVLSGFVWRRNIYSSAVPFIALAGSCVAHAALAFPAVRLRVAAWGFALAVVAYGVFVLIKDVTRSIMIA